MFNLQTSSKLHILIMTESWQGALACIQSLGQKGHTLSVLANGEESFHCRSKYVKNVFHLPSSPDTETSAQHLIQLVEDHHVDLVIPISDEDAYLVAFANEKKASRAFIISSLKAIEVARSRNKTTELCRELKIPVPHTVCINKETPVEKAAESIGFPLYLKISQTVGSSGVRLLHSMNQLSAILKDLPDSAEYQLQKPVSANSLGVTGFALKGQLQKSFAFKMDSRFSIGGTPPYSTLVDEPRAHEILAQITSALNWTGAIDLDFLYTPDQNLYLLEINPRFSGTLIFPLKLGIDLPGYYLTAWGLPNDSLRKIPRALSCNAFITLPQEKKLIKKNLKSGLFQAVQFRLRQRYTSNIFWRDASLNAAWLKSCLKSFSRHIFRSSRIKDKSLS